MSDSMKLNNPLLTAILLAVVTALKQNYGYAGVAITESGEKAMVTSGQGNVGITIHIEQEVRDADTDAKAEAMADLVKLAAGSLYTEDNEGVENAVPWTDLTDIQQAQWGAANLTRLTEKLPPALLHDIQTS